ncbi:hypothetical protein SteCoe_34647 [Stentor coeruleus]|uniref:Uncharacterized protein n=1 Tax=Stentor coeruleus TaxID=5963 RepID=A0A1R2AU26_9CILI|nr:hypothetical protein SteCoe_34647 [Stentor coeruleus]
MKIHSPSRSKISNSHLNQELLQRNIPDTFDSSSLMNCHEKENLVLPGFFESPSKSQKKSSNQQPLKENTQRTGKSSNLLPKSIIYHQKKLSAQLTRHSSISEMLQQLRQKPKQKIPSNHPQPMKRKKTVSFGNYMEMSSPGTKYDYENLYKNKNQLNSLLESSPKSFHKFYSNIDEKKDIFPYTPSEEKLVSYPVPIQKQEKMGVFNNNNDPGIMKKERISDTSVSTQQNCDINDFSHIGIGNCIKFQYEENDENSALGKNKENNEDSIVGYCKSCQRNLKSEAFCENYQKKGCEEITQWILSWVMSGCMQKEKAFIHKCSLCNRDMYKTNQ